MSTHAIAAAAASSPLATLPQMPSEPLSWIHDPLAACVSLVLIVGYHEYLQIRLRNDPAYTIQAVNNQARAAWVHNIMGRSGQEVLAVQTLRNSTMAATFLASTAILLIMGVLNLLQKTASGDAPIITLPGHSMQIQLEQIKHLALLVDFFWAFFCFAQSVRMYNHVGYLINSGPTRDVTISPSYVARLLNRSGYYYSLGMRSYYISVPLVFWLFGPYPLLISSIGLVMVLYHIDRSPEVAEHAKHNEDAPPAEEVQDPPPTSSFGEALRKRAMRGR